MDSNKSTWTESDNLELEGDNMQPSFINSNHRLKIFNNSMTIETGQTSLSFESCICNTHSRKLSTKKLAISMSLFIFIPILKCAIATNNLGTVVESTSDGNIHCEIINPLIVNNQYKIPLSLDSCPFKFSITIKDEFLIDLVKNSQLISDKYFKVANTKSDQLGYKINSHSSSGLSTPSLSKDDDTFYKNHHYISLNNIKNNNEHCHYQGIVNNDLKSISAISVVDSQFLSGFFHSGNKSYYLLANTKNHSTILVTTDTKHSFPSNKNLQYCLDDAAVASNKSTHHRSRRNSLSISSYISDESTNSKRKSSLENKVIHEPYQRNKTSLFVELLIVHDHNQFKEYKGNTTVIAERTMQIVNIMNAFYRQLNIFIALVGVVLWTVEDEIKLTEDGDLTLTNFLKYRNEKLLPRYHHDNAQLITSTSFNGSVVGKALKGPICTHDHSGGVNTDHSQSPTIVAVTLAHELGHNLGMEHDEDNKCSCPDEKCIMSSSSSLVHPKHWSSCSHEYLEESRKHGLLDCLLDEPEQVFGPVCGNGFVEEGEDCDIGEPISSYGTSRSKTKNINDNMNRIVGSRSSSFTTQSDNNLNRLVDNPCCDRASCKFVANATCAQGPCCDLTRCSIFNSSVTRICRPRKTECDFEEICDGISEYCPIDVHYHDGIECGPSALDPLNTITLVNENDQYANNNNDLTVASVTTLQNRKSRSYCYQGQCASHESQCQLLWGTSGTTSRDLCYEQNIHGNISGNCGYNPRVKTYEICEPEDSLCGMLHCVHNQALSTSENSRKTGKLSYGFESASTLTVSFFVMSNHERIYCHGAIIDAGPYMRDPGLVPNGASCGDGRMCLNQKCVPLIDVVNKNWCPSDCNGNGICDNLGVCHCNDGTIGTTCYQFFGSNFHLSFLLYLIMFFGPIVALIILATNHYRNQIKIWWYLHNRKIVLRNKGREPGHHHKLSAQDRRAMAYQAKNQHVSISEPIQSNRIQHNSSTTNEASHAHEPHLDPWAGTNTTASTDPTFTTPTATLVSALTTPTNHPSSATAAAFGLTKTPGYRLEPLQNKPLEPLPPPVPPHQNRKPKLPVENLQLADSAGGPNLRPVRTAPPPPPPPPHANRRRAP